MSNNVRIDISGNNEKLNNSLKESEGMVTKFGKGVTAVFGVIAAAAAAAFVGKQLFDWGAGFVSAAAESQEAEAKLNSVLKATGNAAGFTTEQMVALPEQLQDVTKFEAETTQGAMGILASFRNVRGDVFIDATKAAQDMATVLGTDLSGATMQLGKALNDPVAGITALKRSGVSFTESQEEMINTLIKSGDVMGAQRIILEELSNEFGGAAEEVGRSFSGRMEQMKNRFGDIAESLGAAIMPIVEELMPVVEGFAAFCENILVPIVADVVEKMIEWGKVIISEMQPAFTWLIDGATTAFTVIETVLENFGSYWNLTINTIALGMVKFVDNLRYWFTEVMPAYIVWFVENFTSLMKDWFNVQVSILTNMGKNIWEFVKAVASYMKGDGFDFKMVGLLEGFESTLTALPDIAERAKTGMEKILEDDIARDAGKIGKAYIANLIKNRAAMSDAFDKQERKKVDMTANFKEVDAKELTTKDEKEKKPKKEKEDKEGKETKGDTVGLEELSKKIQSAALKDDEKARQKELKKALEDLIERNKGLADKIADGAKAALALVNANDTLEKAMNNAGNALGNGAGKAVEGIGAIVNRAGDAFGFNGGALINGMNKLLGDANDDVFDEDSRNWLAGIEEMVAEIDANFGQISDSLDEKNSAPSQDEMLAEMRLSTRNQNSLLDAIGSLLNVNKQQLGAAEETVDLLPTVGGLR